MMREQVYFIRREHKFNAKECCSVSHNNIDDLFFIKKKLH